MPNQLPTAAQEKMEKPIVAVVFYDCIQAALKKLGFAILFVFAPIIERAKIFFFHCLECKASFFVRRGGAH